MSSYLQILEHILYWCCWNQILFHTDVFFFAIAIKGFLPRVESSEKSDCSCPFFVLLFWHYCFLHLYSFPWFSSPPWCLPFQTHSNKVIHCFNKNWCNIISDLMDRGQCLLNPITFYLLFFIQILLYAE